MSSIGLFDSELLAVFQNNPPVVTVTPSNLKEMRELTLQMIGGFPNEERQAVEIERRTAAANGHTVPVILYRPAAESLARPAVLHIHGGGFILGNAQMCENYCIKMAADLDSVIVSVDYRLAPEYPFPAALDDCYTALLWMHQEAVNLHIDPDRLAITGESGGGGLAAQLSFLVRDRKQVPVKFVFLTYPMLDDRTASVRDPGQYMGEYFWTRESNVFAWEQYLAGKNDPPPYPAVPSRIENLHGLPPTYIAVGTLDLFATEDVEYALRLTQAGVSAELHVYPGACHAFDYAVGTQLSQAFFEERKRAFKLRLGNSIEAWQLKVVP